MELNVDLLRDLIAWAEADQTDYDNGKFAGWGSWRQSHWGLVDSFDEKEILNGVCQTAYCIAGQAVAQSGYRLLIDRNDEGQAYLEFILNQRPHYAADECILTRETAALDNWGKPIREVVPGEEPRNISETAQEILGLEEWEADSLFNGDNDIVAIKRIANRICAERNLPAMYPEHGCAFYDDEDL